MKGFVIDIEAVTTKNASFRKNFSTSAPLAASQPAPLAAHCQHVTLTLKPGEESGMAVHRFGQFFWVKEGNGEVVLDGVCSLIRTRFAILVPAGTQYNIINTDSITLKIYRLYTPSTQPSGGLQAASSELIQNNEPFGSPPSGRRIPVTTSDHGNNIPISRHPPPAVPFLSPENTFLVKKMIR